MTFVAFVNRIFNGLERKLGQSKYLLSLIDTGLAGPLLGSVVVFGVLIHGQWLENGHPRTHFLGSKRVGTGRLLHTVYIKCGALLKDNTE